MDWIIGARERSSLASEGGAAVSDTPRTDQLAKREFVPDGLWIKLVRELERENADRDLTLATIQDIIDDSYRTDRSKVMAIKYELSQ